MVTTNARSGGDGVVCIWCMSFSRCLPLFQSVLGDHNSRKLFLFCSSAGEPGRTNRQGHPLGPSTLGDLVYTYSTTSHLETATTITKATTTVVRRTDNDHPRNLARHVRRPRQSMLTPQPSSQTISCRQLKTVLTNEADVVVLSFFSSRLECRL